MCETVKINPLNPNNAHLIADWCKDKNEDFLRQWAGNGYSYPLTEKQICDRLAVGEEIFEAHLGDKMIGTIEVISTDEQKHTALIGRFVLDQTITKRGLGTQMLSAFLQYCKETLSIFEVTLYVFDFNVAAYRCYQKCGFMENGIEERPNGWKAIRMSKVL
ncbi:MAG: GNAT family N-acetyltransferase [Lachnospiraceae bacterium]|nr:GNAT family N-acetyltransferase [Lachnospiraceae bacterium]